ncbi:MAG: hypothetical protein DI536_04455 [Archangium gephyra]|uniref:RelA/SpoT domain-containing protein n=1 Tax=Archangium gephyra TaxID=48 RepID=A0A2W5W341_9BACT|nr:MAG: hypothetical protein DI536_04455 [Archangium gephyra]
MSDGFLEHYEALQPELSRLGDSLERALRGWLFDAGIPTHLVTWRLKSLDSLANKLARPDKTYRQLWDVTDLVGLRIATSFEDHVDKAAQLIERHLKIDFARSAARTKPAGYRSVHYICSVDGGPHDDFRIEIQIRTALQHAWAEVEHDLGYKATDDVPEAIRHRFTRVAGLLEIADAEFMSIRRDLAASREAARAALERRDVVPLDLLSLDALLKHDAVQKLDASVAATLHREVTFEPFFPGYLVKLLRAANLTTTAEVLAAVDRHAAHVPQALTPYFVFASTSLAFEPASIDVVHRGYGLLFIALLTVIRGEGLALEKAARLTRLYEQTEFPGDQPTAQRVAGALLTAFAV